MTSKPEKTLEEVAESVGTYTTEAFAFVRDGLNHAINNVHGSPSVEQMRLFQYLNENEIELSDLIEAFHAGELPPQLESLIEATGGVEGLNRHVSGPELCWGLRDVAMLKWGFMARSVLNAWGVRATIDFGKIVFAMIEHGLMQKQPSDNLDDFRDVFVFKEAFDQSYPFNTICDS